MGGRVRRTREGGKPGHMSCLFRCPYWRKPVWVPHSHGGAGEEVETFARREAEVGGKITRPGGGLYY